MEVAFRSSEIAFFKESFILASGNGFSINYKLCAFIRSFFLLVHTIFEIRCKPIFFASGNGFFSNASFRRAERDFLLSFRLFRANLGETIFYRVISLLLLEAIFYVFFLDIRVGESSFSAWWKNIFLTNPSFWLVESEFLSIGNNILLFTAFFCYWKPLLALNSVFPSRK